MCQLWRTAVSLMGYLFPKFGPRSSRLHLDVWKTWTGMTEEKKMLQEEQKSLNSNGQKTFSFEEHL